MASVSGPENHPPGIGEALAAIEGNLRRAVGTELLALAQWNVMTRAEAERAYFPSPGLRFSMSWDEVAAWQKREAEKRAAEELDRREWLKDVRRRLGLVSEVHRCRAWYAGEGWWRWACLRPGCVCGGFARRGPGGFRQATGEALEHARRFVAQPEPWTELDVLAFEAAQDAVRDEEARFAAALPARMEAVAEQINEALSGILPEGLRFEWH
jgi:hypothetical protein